MGRPTITNFKRFFGLLDRKSYDRNQYQCCKRLAREYTSRSKLRHMISFLIIQSLPPCALPIGLKKYYTNFMSFKRDECVNHCNQSSTKFPCKCSVSRLLHDYLVRTFGIGRSPHNYLVQMFSLQNSAHV